MYKLLIVDDEPLVQVGIKSMLNWQKLNIEVIGTAPNGSVAFDLISKLSPDIVITDIKMPVMDGLELLKKCRETFGYKFPVFLVLTSFEDFRMAKEAISYQALEYLVKLELNPDSLSQAIQKCIEYMDENRQNDSVESGSSDSAKGNPYSYTEKFMISLLNNLFESSEQMALQAKELSIDLDYDSYICCYGSFEKNSSESDTTNKSALYNSALQMLEELSAKYYNCYSLSLDTSHFALLFCSKSSDNNDCEADVNQLQDQIFDLLKKVTTSIKNYMNIQMLCGIGSTVFDPQSICDSYQSARLAYRQVSCEEPLMYLSALEPLPHDAFNISIFKADLIKSYEEYDSELFINTISELCELISSHPRHYVQAMDMASNILYMSLSLLSNGADILNDIFSDYPESYMSLYKQTNVIQIVNWLTHFSTKLGAIFDECKKDYKNRIVIDVKNHINEHVREKLSLNQVAAQFGVSPSYLSQLFGRYSDVGFSEYINIAKINLAKKMLREEHYKVYEVSELLSFSNEFYFSKVFKKLEGVSPTEYANGGY